MNEFSEQCALFIILIKSNQRLTFFTNSNQTVLFAIRVNEIKIKKNKSFMIFFFFEKFFFAVHIMYCRVYNVRTLNSYLFFFFVIKMFSLLLIVSHVSYFTLLTF